MGTAIFITGTDTGVGKTFVSCGSRAYLTVLGYSVGVMKPAETGCAEKGGELFADDAYRLKQASDCAEPIERICPYRLPEPLAPSIAAERAGVKIDIDRLLSICHEITAQHDITLIEGAGGLMVPLLPSYTFADFARVAKLPILVVAANKLGAINHLLLTLEHASCKGLRTAGYVLNQIENQCLWRRKPIAKCWRIYPGCPVWPSCPIMPMPTLKPPRWRAGLRRISTAIY